MGFHYYMLIGSLAVFALEPPTHAAAPVSADVTAPRPDHQQTDWLPLGLQSYEPSAFGYTKNNDDVSFENVKLSVKFPIAPKLTYKYWGDADQVFFSFTGYWGFYIKTRPSGPVVGKEYNPQLFWQHNLVCHKHSESKYRPDAMYGMPSAPAPFSDRNCYFAIGYNHSSNGQTISTLAQYEETARDQGAEAANDAVSRGWDYIRVTGRYIAHWSEHDRITLYPTLKYFLNDGLLQGPPEELHDWEHPPDGKHRKEVDGITLLTKYQRKFVGFDTKLVAEYTTGYQNPFKFSTVRIEAGIAVWELPIVFWIQKGYMSDLAQYYRNVTGYGVQIEVGGF